MHIYSTDVYMHMYTAVEMYMIIYIDVPLTF